MGQNHPVAEGAEDRVLSPAADPARTAEIVTEPLENPPSLGNSKEVGWVSDPTRSGQSPNLQVDTLEVSDARRRTHAAWGEQIRRAIRQPKLEAEDLATIQTAMALLEKRDAVLAKPLQTE
jgi:hypothetical protein